MRATAPEWVLEALKDIDTDVSIGFEDESLETDWQSMIQEIDELETRMFPVADNSTDDDKEVQISGGEGRETIVMQSIKSVEEAWNNNANIKQEIIEEEDLEREEVTEQLQLQAAPQGQYVTRSGRISRPPARLIETAYATIRETYLDNFCHIENDTKELVECTYAMKALLFQAMQEKPVEAMRALREEVIKAIKIDIWDPVHPKDMLAEERKLIIPQMMN